MAQVYVVDIVIGYELVIMWPRTDLVHLDHLCYQMCKS